MLTFKEFINEAKSPLTHKINSEKYWKKVLYGNDFAMKILDTILSKQNGMASDRQWEVLKRAESGDKTPYHPTN